MRADQSLRAAGCAEEELWALLAALERHGVVRVYSRPGPTNRPGPVNLPGPVNSPRRADSDPGPIGPILPGVRASRPDWPQAHRLRKAGLQGLRAVRDYATTATCRRSALLGYFGDEVPICGGCDVCGDASSSAGRRLA
jgi:hypothetical protein